MLIKSLSSKLRIPLDSGMCLETLLLPEERYTATYLHEAEEFIPVYQYKLCFNKVCHVTFIVETTCEVAGTSHGVSSARDQIQLKLLPIKHRALVLYIALYDWHDPSCINFLIDKILANVVIPEIPLIACLPHALVPAKALTPDLPHPLAI